MFFIKYGKLFLLFNINIVRENLLNFWSLITSFIIIVRNLLISYSKVWHIIRFYCHFFIITLIIFFCKEIGFFKLLFWYFWHLKIWFFKCTLACLLINFISRNIFSKWKVNILRTRNSAHIFNSNFKVFILFFDIVLKWLNLICL